MRARRSPDVQSAQADASGTNGRARVPICADGTLQAPAWPESWYLVCRSSDVPSGGVVSSTLAGRPIVLFRELNSSVRALSAQCAHMGAHLGRGTVVGDRVRCPLHHWEYGGDGICQSIPGATEIPTYARQRAYAVAERFGGVFVFSGLDPSFPPPAFSLAAPDLQVGHGRSVHVRCPWFAVAANAFDMQHLQTVHRRALREPPAVEQPDRYRLRLRYVSRVVGHTVADRTVRWLSGDRVRVAITCWGGTALTVESWLGGMRSFLLLSLLPTADGTEIRPIFGAPRRRAGAVSAAHAAGSRWLFSKFLEADVGILDGMRFRPRLPLPEGEPMRRYLEYVDGLPAPPG